MRGYNLLSKNGFEHEKVNHSENFVNPIDASINTQKIERMWRTIKSIIPKGAHNDIRWTYLSEFIFKQNNKWFNISLAERIQLILQNIKLIKFE